jgi:ketosteroid isomerase-like protein
VSQENVELARRGYEAWNRDDLDAVLATYHQQFEFRTSGVFPGLDRVYRGREGFRRFWEDFHGPWESVRIVIEELRQSGERVVALYVFEAKGRDGMAVRRPAANVITYRDGLATRIDAYGDWKEALEAVGLRE